MTYLLDVANMIVVKHTYMLYYYTYILLIKSENPLSTETRHK